MPNEIEKTKRKFRDQAMLAAFFLLTTAGFVRAHDKTTTNVLVVIEYTILFCLIFRALRLDKKPIIAFVETLLIALPIVLMDEGIKYLIVAPNYDLNEIIFSLISGVAGFGVIQGIRRLRAFKPIFK